MDIHPSDLLMRRIPVPRTAASDSPAKGIAGVVRALWRKLRAHSGDRDDSFIDLSEHMRKDIGVNDRLQTHRGAGHRRGMLARLGGPFLIIALIAPSVLDAAGGAAERLPMAKARAQQEMVGVPTGEEVNGAPVYRLPSIVVVARSKVARASDTHGKQAAREQQVRAKAVARSPV